MLKGLLTRQVFVLIDVALALLFLLVIYLVGRELLQKAPSAPAARNLGGDTAAPQLPKPGPRANYDIILASRLFGNAGAMAPPVEAAPPPPPPPVDTQTKFNLKLVATTFTKPKANALITNKDTQETKVFWPDEVVLEGQVKLLEVHNRWVLLSNLRTKGNEILSMDEPQMNVAALPTPGGHGSIAPPGPRNAIKIKREEIAQELETITGQLDVIQNTMNPRPYQDASGKVVGFTADNISTNPLLKKMGLRDGDVVSKINGIDIDSQAKIAEVIGKFQSSTSFHINILRNGKPQLLQYNITE